MTWPPATQRTDLTPDMKQGVENHAGIHNSAGQAINDIVAKINSLGSLNGRGLYSANATYAQNDVVARGAGAYRATTALAAGNDPLTALVGGTNSGLFTAATNAAVLNQPFIAQPYTTGANAVTISAVQFKVGQGALVGNVKVGIASSLGASPSAVTWLATPTTAYTLTYNAGEQRMVVVLDTPAALAANTTYYVVFYATDTNGAALVSLGMSPTFSGNVSNTTTGIQYSSGAGSAWGTTFQSTYWASVGLGSQLWDVFAAANIPTWTAGASGGLAWGSGASAAGSTAFAVGQGSTAGGQYSQSFGFSTTADASYSFAQGFQSKVNGQPYAAVWGNGATARQWGMHAKATQNGTLVGQHGDVNIWATTTDATATDVAPSGPGWGPGTSFELPASRSYYMRIAIVARRTNATGQQAAFTWEGLVARDSSGHARIVGTPATQSWADAGVSGWGLSVIIDTSIPGTDYVRPQVTGAVGANINWSGRIDFVECD